TRKSVQRYKCMACGHRFSGGQEITTDYIWEMYLHGKQTVAQISAETGLSVDNCKRMMNGFFLAYIKKHNTKGDNL
ncbi:MAG: hypothetical protein PUD64_08125, partial [Bacteroidales bacterium]|nr:hypothetical protein [Bacteroidales bacterium]